MRHRNETRRRASWGMASELVVLDGSTFFVSDEAGDVRDGGPAGFFFQDVRHLSRWALSVNGAQMRVPGDGALTIWHERQGVRRGTRVTWWTPGRITDGAIQFEITLAPRGEWEVCLDISCIVDGQEHGPREGHGGFGKLEPQMPRTLQAWLADAPTLETDSDLVQHTYRRSLVDLAALRFRPSANLTWSLPAAGLPWFMALFGRDRLITAYMALPFQPHLAHTTLEALAGLQATEWDDFRDAAPGKILHEVRRGWLATLGEVPHSAYYGSHDATPLFLVLLDEYHRWTGDDEFVRRLEPEARAAIAWIEGPGDPDGDGYLEYETRSPNGLRNQGWKDSWNAILFADGRLADPPIAMCEVQGYAYDARIRAARLARVSWHDPELADRLERDATSLKERFDRDFWLEERGHYALALDRDKRPVDALTSNVGHLLWSGIVAPGRAATVRDRLMAPDMFSGWGIRTMSSRDAGYNPIEYHNGTVWPHDTAIVAEGLRRYGFRDDANRVAFALFEAAEAFEYRLPEVFAGYDRDATTVAVEYPTASSPQAWAAAAPLLAIRTMLGLDAEEGRATTNPALPPSIHELRLVPSRADAG